MIPILLCLPILLLLTSAGLARPLRNPVASPSCRSGQRSMPDLSALILRSSPRVVASGHLIKGLYYVEHPDGSNTVAAFFLACDHVLARKPFLIMDFRSNRFFLDGNRDGCVDAAGALSTSELDPADFVPGDDGSDELCAEELIGQGQFKELVAMQGPPGGT